MWCARTRARAWTHSCHGLYPPPPRHRRPLCIGVAYTNVPVAKQWFPCIGLDSNCPVSINFGEAPFVFDVHAFGAGSWATLAAAHSCSVHVAAAKLLAVPFQRRTLLRPVGGLFLIALWPPLAPPLRVGVETVFAAQPLCVCWWFMSAFVQFGGGGSHPCRVRADCVYCASRGTPRVGVVILRNLKVVPRPRQPLVRGAVPLPLRPPNSKRTQVLPLLLPPPRPPFLLPPLPLLPLLAQLPLRPRPLLLLPMLLTTRLLLTPLLLWPLPPMLPLLPPP